MEFEEALKALKKGKIISDGIREIRICQFFQTRHVDCDDEWREFNEFMTDEVLSDYWEIVERKE